MRKCHAPTPLLVVIGLLLAPGAMAGPCGDPSQALPAPYDALLRGEAALEGGRLDEAVTALAAADGVLEGPAARRRRLLLGRAQAAQGRPEAAATLRSALDGVDAAGYRASRCDADPAEVRWWLAEALPEGEKAAVWRAIWTSNPSSPRSAEAEARLAAVDAAFPDRDTVLARAATLAGLQQHPAVLALLEARVPDDGTVDHALMMARALFRAKEYRRAVDAFGALDHPPLQDRFDRALAASRTGDYGQAAALYRALVDEHAGQAAPPDLIDTASYKLGYLDYDAGRLEEGVRGFREHLARFPRSQHATEALWFVGWSLVKLDRPREAREAFARLVADHPRSTLVPGARYWSARLAGLAGEGEVEVAGMAQILVDHADSAYAWWAARRLGRTWDAPPPPAPSSSSSVDDPALLRGLALERAGLDDWAAAEFGALVASTRKRGREATLALAERLAGAGEWHQAASLARPWCDAPERRADLRALRLCWPRPEGATASAAAVAGGLPPHLPFAIMKAESGYTPTITSPAGARGLMQLMPALGVERYAALHGGAVLDPDALFDPAVNAELGVSELVELRRRFEDAGVDPVLPLVIAGYNGGADAVKRWLAEQPRPVQVDRFSEDIGYSETRRYVRRVLGALQVYRLVYGDDQLR